MVRSFADRTFQPKNRPVPHDPVLLGAETVVPLWIQPADAGGRVDRAGIDHDEEQQADPEHGLEGCHKTRDDELELAE